MDKKNKHIEQLTPELIQAYHSGTLTSSEMHQVELLMLETPMYNEGIEGLELLSPEELELDIETLSAQIDQATEDEKIGFWITWKKAAAVILVLISAGGLFYLNQPANLTTKELSEVKKPLENVASDSIANKDSLSDESKLKFEPQTSSPTLEKIEAKREELYDSTKEDLDQKALSIPDPEITTIKIDPSKAGELLTNKVLGLRTEPSPMISTPTIHPKLPKTSDSVPALSEKLFFEPMKVQSSKRNLIPEKSKINLELEKPLKNSELNEGEALAGKIAGVRVVPLEEDQLEPFMIAKPDKGYPKFRRYLRKNLRYPEAAKPLKIRGQVTVEFRVSSTGELFDFRIIKGLGYGCDEEAIRLIKEGPKWNPKTIGAEKRPVLSIVTVKVRFRP